jgi:sugar lactone lactonase YvrE
MRTFFRLSMLLLLVVPGLAACSDDNDDSAAPKRIALPAGFQPEGIASSGNLIFVGSIPTGAVYRADIATGAGSILVPGQEGRAAIGLKVDGRGRIFVAGGPTGMAFVYDAVSGENLAAYTLTAATTFVNDVVVTADAAWFTDSINPVLYRLDLPADGSLGGPEAVATLTLSGDLQFQEGFNVNGIAATGDRLIVVQSNTGLLFTVDPATGATVRIDLGTETLPNGDGILLEGLTLFVVQNQLNQVAVVDLAPGLAAGTVRTRITDPDFDVPTTIAAAGTSLYAVNARFGVEVTPQTPYSVVRFARP